jgi:hypothetical protein
VPTTHKLKLLSTLEAALHTAPELADSTCFSGMWPVDSPVEQLMQATPRLIQLFHELPRPTALSFDGLSAVPSRECRHSSPEVLALIGKSASNR